MMATLLGAFIRSARVGQRLTLQSLAARVGYRNQNKGATRIERLERDGGAATDLLDRVTFALGLDQQTLAQLAARDEPDGGATCAPAAAAARQHADAAAPGAQEQRLQGGAAGRRQLRGLGGE